MSWYSIVRRFGTTSTPWNPSLDSNVFGWWDTSTLTTSDTVTNVNGDQALLEFYDNTASIVARTYDYQTKDERGPILVSGTQNGNALLEQASQRSPYGSLSTDDLGDTGTFTKIMFASVARNTSQGSTGIVDTAPLMMAISDDTLSRVKVMWSDQGSGQVATTTRRPHFETNVGDTRYAPGAVVNNVDDWQIYSATFDLATGKCQLFVNGVGHYSHTFPTPVGSISKSTARVSVFGDTSYNLNNKTPNGAQGGEFVFAESTDSTLRQKCEGYLAHEWGLTANLYSSHPYKSSPPALGQDPVDTEIQVSGGTETTSGGYKYHTFTSSGTLTVSSPGNLEYCVVASGGIGGAGISGGGGGGGVRTGTLDVSVGSYTVTVGGTTTFEYPTNGQSSSFVGFDVNVSCIGGGKGGTISESGFSGGSGGGAAGRAATTAGGAGTAGEGNDGGGGTGTTGNDTGGGGGGGAGAAGSQGQIAAGGNGGNGVEWPVGSGTYYGGGGGGGVDSRVAPRTAGSGGLGGGGAGSDTNNVAATNGAPNTGGGGGGGSTGSFSRATGGSGIVIIRYPI